MTQVQATRWALGAPWFTQEPEAVVDALGTDAQRGLTSAEAGQRLEELGPNAIAAEPSPSVWQLALKQLVDPMNVMLVAVAVIGFFISQATVGIMVALLVVVNVVLGAQQELRAQRSVDALADLQVPQARVTRDGVLLEVPATDLVPGDVLALEAGDVVPADGRVLRSASLETQESALTGESAPVEKSSETLADPTTGVGDRVSMVFQNTEVTRGTATVVVTETGMGTQMGQIASMLSAVVPGKSPLQKELGGLTRVLSIIAWGAVAVIVVIGLLRGESTSAVLLLGISMAISAIPTGLPTFVQSMLARGSNELAAHRAIVKNLADVETLGATSAINSDKTGTLTLNAMTVSSLYYRHEWFSVGGGGYEKTGDVRCVAGRPVPDFTALAYGLCLCSDATVSDDGTVVGDPTEAALVVLAAKLGVDAELTRRDYPRVAEVPFDSAYKFMATFHHVPLRGREQLSGLVKGGPDVILARCDRAVMPGGEVVPIDQVREDLEAANRELSSKGLRVLAFGFVDLEGREEEVVADPVAAVRDLVFVGLVGIIDPLRPSSKEAVRVAQRAGIEVRMITGDHAITAGAIGAELGLGRGAISGAELQSMSDEEVTAALPGLHVFGRVTPQDKLRLARLMQDDGAVVAMTGDAVNDAAALKQADVGVAMGSGSEVTKQAGNMILTDDNFGTLVAAVRIGRAIYDKIVGYVRFQMSLLFSLVLLFLVASVFHVNGGVPLTPLMVLFLNFFVTIFPVVVIMLDPAPADIMDRPPRDPAVTIARPGAVVQWLFYGALMFATTIVPLLVVPGDRGAGVPSVPVTMAFVVSALGSLLGGLAIRRDPASGLAAPVLTAVRWLAVPAALTVVSVEVGFMQQWLGTVDLDGRQWIACLGLAAIVPLVVELEKWARRARAARRA